MERKELEKLIAGNDERLLGEYGMQLRARNAAHADQLAQQIGRAALAEMRRTPKRYPTISIVDILMGGRRGFALAGAMAMIAIFTLAYTIFGGRPITPEVTATASSNGVQISAQHNGLFGLTWHMPLAFNATAGLTAGDEIQTGASTSVTLSFATGTTSVIAPNSLARIESLAPLSVRVLHGEVTNHVTPATVAGIPAFEVVTARAFYTVRGTIYNVRVAGNGDLIKTNEGSVAVRTTRSEQLVSRGQQADVTDTGLITRQLSSPEVEMILPDGRVARAGDIVTTNMRQGMIKIMTAAGAQIKAAAPVAGQTAAITGPLQADRNGEVTLPIQMPEHDGAFEVSFVATDMSGQKIGSATSQPLTVVVDRTPPSRFVFTEPLNNTATSSPARLSGVTEPNTTMTISGSPIMVRSDGSFSANVPLQDGPNVIEVIIIDAAGNSLRVEETIYLLQ